MNPGADLLPAAPAHLQFFGTGPPDQTTLIALLAATVVMTAGLLLPGLFLFFSGMRRLPAVSKPPRPGLSGIIDGVIVLCAALLLRVPGLANLGLNHMEPAYRLEVGPPGVTHGVLELLLHPWAGVHMPLYRFLLAGWIWLTGDGTVLTARWLSVALGSLAALLVLGWARTARLPRWACLAAGLLVAVGPHAVEFSRHTSLYALALFGAAGLLRAHAAYAAAPGRRTLASALLWNLITAGAHLLCWWYIAAAALLILLRKDLSATARRAYLGAALIPFGLFIYIVFHGALTMVGLSRLHEALELFTVTESLALDSLLLPLRLSGELALGPLLPAVLCTVAGAALCALCVRAIVAWWPHRRRDSLGNAAVGTAALAAITLLGILGQLAANSLSLYLKSGNYLYPIRHVTVAVPAMAALLAALAARPGARAARVGLIALLVTLAGQSLWAARAPSGRPDTSAPARLLRQRLAHRDMVAVAPPFIHAQLLVEPLLLAPLPRDGRLVLPFPSRTLPTSLGAIRQSADGIVGLGAAHAGLPLKDAVAGCFAHRIWLLRFDERLPNGQPEFSLAVANREVAALTGALGPALEHHAGHGFELARYAAHPWLLTPASGRLEIPLDTHGHLVLLGAAPPSRWVKAPRELDSRSFLCAPLPAGSPYQLTLVADPQAPHPVDVILEQAAGARAEMRCPVVEVDGQFLARCPPRTAADERPLWRVRDGGGQARWTTLVLSWGPQG